MDRVASLVERIKGRANQTGPRRPELMVDAAGVGLGVVGMLKDRGLRYRTVSITGGISRTVGGGTPPRPE